MDNRPPGGAVFPNPSRPSCHDRVLLAHCRHAGRLVLLGAALPVPDATDLQEGEATPVVRAEWRRQYSGTTDDAGDAADYRDSDHDGLENLVRYAFGLAFPSVRMSRGCQSIASKACISSLSWWSLRA
jgi:hypothetical protein